MEVHHVRGELVRIECRYADECVDEKIRDEYCSYEIHLVFADRRRVVFYGWHDSTPDMRVSDANEPLRDIGPDQDRIGG
jgi:hypothetical protein